MSNSEARKWVITLLALVGLCGCATTTHPPVTVLPVISTEANRKALLDADSAFSRLSEEKGAAQAFYQFLAPEATYLPMGGPPIKGREAIRIHLSAGTNGVLKWKPAEADVARSGDSGYTWGNYEFQSTGPDGQAQTNYGKYITVWRKQPDGSWKAVLDGSNLSPPPSERR